MSSVKEFMNRPKKPTPEAGTTNPVIKLIPQSIHYQLFGKFYNEVPKGSIDEIKHKLDLAGLGELTDTSELIDLPIPKLSKNLPEWIDEIIESTYGKYFVAMNGIRKVDFLKVRRPTISPYQGWSKYENDEWCRCKGIGDTAIVFDFETYPDENGLMHPFMMAAVDQHKTIYSWLSSVMTPLPEVVEFGEEVELFIGHNSVSFDRRFVKEFYDFNHDKRMLDTYSFYSVLYGMSSDQIEKYRWASKLENCPFPWVKCTTNGNLKDLAAFILGVDMDKSIREDLLKPKKVKGKLEVTPKSIIEAAMPDIWEYCLTDTINTGRIFQIFVKRILEYETKIYLAGQLERSTLRIAVDADIKSKIQKVVSYNNEQLKKLNRILIEQLDLKLESNDPYMVSMLKGYVCKDWYERIFKSKKFQDYWKTLNPEQIETLAEGVILPDGLIDLGWEHDDEETKRSERKNKTLLKLAVVHHYLTAGNETKIQCRGTKEWVTKLLKSANEKIDESHVSVAGKITPVLIGLRWCGERLFVRGNTWGIQVENEFVALPHSKGKKNVGSPLSKDYLTLAAVGKFTADIDLLQFFDIVSETSLWEKFNKRFEAIYVHKNIWLPAIVPSGTISGRMTGTLALVMANPDTDGEAYEGEVTRWDGSVYTPKKQFKSTRAGSEMKSWFRVEEGHTKVNADYSGQESEIFTALIDAITQWSGLNIFSCLVHAGNSDLKTDIHSFVARYLSGECGREFPRTLAKNCNFANQFFGGSEKLGTMIYIALKGAMTREEAYNIAVKFQEFTRGVQSFGKYYDGIASEGFNKIKELAKRDNQKCLLTGRIISDPLNARWCGKDDLTTRINFSIQGVGQGLIDIDAIVTRYMANLFGIPYNMCFMIHDDIAFDTEDINASTLAYFMQIGHLFSKGLLYHKFGVESMPLNKMYFETVEFDKVLRKSPTSSYLTPTQEEPIPHGYVLKAKDCLPHTRIIEYLSKCPI